MITLNYTGAIKQDEAQLEPLFSLGGYVSSSPVANDFFSNLFGEITLNTVKNQQLSHIVLGLRTDESLDSIDFTIKTTKSNQGRFRISSVKITKDDCDKFNIPKIQNSNSKPVNLKFFDCTSFYGETKIGFTVNPIEGEVFEIWSGTDQIGEIVYDINFEEVTIFSQFQDEFELERRLNLTSEQFELFLIQKDLINFNPAIEIIQDSTGTPVEDTENQLPELNVASLGSLTTEELMALYIERSISRETIKENRKLNCDKFFLEYHKGFKADTTEKAELEIEYETTPAP